MRTNPCTFRFSSMVEIDSRSMCELAVRNNETYFPLASTTITSAASMKRILLLALIAIRADFSIATVRLGRSGSDSSSPAAFTTSRRWGSPLSNEISVAGSLLPLSPKSIVAWTAVNRRLLPVHPASLLSFRLRHLFPRFVVRAELPRHRLESGIELHKRMLDSSMILVARPAGVALGHGFGRFAVDVEKVVRPLIRIPRRIFHLDHQSRQIGLIMALLVDGTSARCIPLVNHEHALLRPLPGVRKFAVSPALHKNVGKHFVAVGAWAVVHAVSGGEKHPLAVVGRPDKLALPVILRLRRFFSRPCGQQNKSNSQNKHRTQSAFHRTLILPSKMWDINVCETCSWVT